MSKRKSQQPGAVNTLLAPVAFFNDAVLTKYGDLFVVLRIEGADPECMETGAVEQTSTRYEQAMRTLGVGYRVYQYVFKRAKPPLAAEVSCGRLGAARAEWLESRRPSLFSVELYLVLLRQRPLKQKAAGLLEKMSVRRQLTVDEEALQREYEMLSAHADSMELQLASVIHPRRLDKADTLGFLRSLANVTDWKAAVYGEVQDSHLDQQIACSNLDAHRNHLRQDEFFIKYMSMAELPSQTAPYLLRGLLPIDCNMTICSEWMRMSNDKMHAIMGKKRRHFHLRKTSPMSFFTTSQPQPHEVLVDDSAAAVVKVLNDALTEIEVNENHYGKFAFTVALYHEDEAHLRRSCAKVAEVLGSFDSKAVEEDWNQLNCWTAMIPGNYANSLRQSYLINTCYADMSFLFRPAAGSRWNGHLNAPALAILETQERTPYYLNLHVGDVPHTVMIGSIGSGKSFLANFLVSCYQQYLPYTAIFDLGGSYRRLAKEYDGAYLHIGKQNDFTINPFCLPPSEENLGFLFAFCQVLIERDDYTMAAEDRIDLYRTITDMYVLDRADRRLDTLAKTCSRTYAGRLWEWVGEGRLAGYFDHAEDTLTFQKFQVFDFEGLSERADVLQPMLFYILHRASTIIYDKDLHDVPKLVVFDEAWKFFSNPVTQSYIREALKTWRKRNGAMILATQSADDLMRSGLHDTVLESCMTRIFLANPGMDSARYEEEMQVSKAEAKMIRQLTEKRQFLLKQGGISKVLNLLPDELSRQVFSNAREVTTGKE